MVVRCLFLFFFVFFCFVLFFFVFFFNDTATTEIYTLSLHDALPISPSISFISLYFSFLSSPIISSQSQLGHSHYTNSLRCCQSWCHVAAGLYRDVSQYDHIADTGIHEQWPDRANQFTHPDSKVTLPHDGLYPPYYRLTGLCSSYSVHSPLQLSFYSHQKFIYMKMRNSTETGWSSLFNSDIGGL